MIGMVRRSFERSLDEQRDREERLFVLKIEKVQITPLIGKEAVF